MMLSNKIWSSSRFLYGSVILLVSSVLLKLWLFESMVKFVIRDQTALRKRNQVREVYLKIPFPLNFKLYFFNVTNPEEIQTGSKPKLKEVGPFWYDEIKEKVQIIDNDTEDSLTYTPYDLFEYNQNKSNQLREDDYVTIIHPAIVGMVNLVLRDSPVFLSIVSKAIPSIFNNPQTIFLTAKVKDILFDGVELNCLGKDFGTTAVCSQMKSQIPGLKFKKDNENIFLFSLLGSRNGTLTRRLKVHRGIAHAKDLGRLVELDGKKEINIWRQAECNRFHGTDGWIFPALSTPEEGLPSFSTDLCSLLIRSAMAITFVLSVFPDEMSKHLFWSRSVNLRYINDTVLKKIPVRIYETDLGDQMTDENEKCYCRSADSCLKKGVFDLSKCMGVPIYATLPHFLRTDPSYINLVDGLAPSELLHAIRVYFEPMTGTPLFAAKRMQFNLDLKPTNKIPLFSHLPTALFPMFWLEESVDLDGYLLKKVQTVFLLLHAVDIIQYLMIVIGCGCVTISMYFRLKNRKSVTITPATGSKKSAPPKPIDEMDVSHLSIAGILGDRPQKKAVVSQVMSGHEFDKY
ncbi:sensory neuron membrane protein 1 isoform X1 [Dendroctonus ponderosae]|uniref:Sensory neuron membrane protein n=1 Tax=Dendroctonus ponderosae TaxID=77166 RepID=I1VJ83_DENPD|nr:sensory neuron membrane protein 1 isoform X1 [Dendroctonus ponderosae]AFI45067.1 sensory neuron membrane protein [Dendroctonus ponderosae]KAH1028811.1 hypothetical protein HUJ05_002141 [Dendroctonus ponderosae]